MSAIASQTDRAVEKCKEQPIVDTAFAADDGYVIAILNRTDVDGSIFQLIDLADWLGFDNTVEVYNDFMHDGEQRDAVHMIADDR